jgi:hypothetical protein
VTTGLRPGDNSRALYYPGGIADALEYFSYANYGMLIEASGGDQFSAT